MQGAITDITDNTKYNDNTEQIILSIYLFVTDNVYLQQIFICFSKRVSQLLTH